MPGNFRSAANNYGKLNEGKIFINDVEWREDYTIWVPEDGTGKKEKGTVMRSGDGIRKPKFQKREKTEIMKEQRECVK